MRAVNLLPADRDSAKRSQQGGGSGRRNVLIGGAVVGVLVVAGLCALVWTSNSSLSDKNKQLATLQSQIATTSFSSTSLAAGTSTRKVAVVGLVDDRLAWDQFLGDLSKLMPEDVWLQNLQATTPGAAATLAATAAAAASAATAASSTSTTSAPPAVTPVASTFQMSGFTYSQPSVARMMRRLTIVPWLSNVSLVSSSKTTIGSDIVFEFTVKATLATTPTAPAATPPVGS